MAELTPQQHDALKELGNVGAGNAANALSTMLNIKVSLTPPTVSVIRMSHLWAGSDVNLIDIVAIILGLTGEVPGHIVVAFDRSAARDMAVVFVQRVLHKAKPSDLEIVSALQEFGNILAGAYLRAVNMLTQRNLGLTVPKILTGMTKTVLTQLPGYENDAEVALINSKFVTGDNNAISGQVILSYNTDEVVQLLGQFA